MSELTDLNQEILKLRQYIARRICRCVNNFDNLLETCKGDKMSELTTSLWAYANNNTLTPELRTTCDGAANRLEALEKSNEELVRLCEWLKDTIEDISKKDFDELEIIQNHLTKRIAQALARAKEIK
jgi:hypothetical protein